jgi:hypothetical protein
MLIQKIQIKMIEGFYGILQLLMKNDNTVESLDDFIGFTPELAVSF